MDVRFQSAFEPLDMHSSKRDRRPFPKRPGASSPMFSPPFKGTMLCLGLETHHCSIGLCFRRNRTPENITLQVSGVSYFLSPGAPRLMCFVENIAELGGHQNCQPFVSPFQGSGLLVTDNLGLRSRGSLQPRL